MDKLLPLIIVIAVMVGIVGAFVLAIRWARKSSRRAAFLGWGVQLLGAGMDPLPPAQEQLEAASRQTKIKKQSESGDPE